MACFVWAFEVGYIGKLSIIVSFKKKSKNEQMTLPFTGSDH